MKQTEVLTRVTHVNGWELAAHIRCTTQNFRLFHVSNVSVQNLRSFLLTYSVTCRSGRPAPANGTAEVQRRAPRGPPSDAQLDRHTKKHTQTRHRRGGFSNLIQRKLKRKYFGEVEAVKGISARDFGEAGLSIIFPHHEIYNLLLA